MAFFPQYLTVDEEAQIHQQFQGDIWRRNDQVLWSGILGEEAQLWADEHEMQTLTTAMGPLMDLSHPLCPRNQKSSEAWAKYVKGASAIFAWYISKGERVTVLSPPPPGKFHPSGSTNYQAIEEPIVRGKLGTSAVSRIEMVHPTVKGAESIYYQLWPVDQTTTWRAKFGELNVQKRRWRMVKNVKAFSNNLGDIETIIKPTKQHEYKPMSPDKEEEGVKKRIEEEEKNMVRKEKKIAKKEKMAKKEKTAKEEKKIETKKKKIAKKEKKREEEEEVKKRIEEEKNMMKKEKKMAEEEEMAKKEKLAKKEKKIEKKKKKKAKKEKKKAKKEKKRKEEKEEKEGRSEQMRKQQKTTTDG